MALPVITNNSPVAGSIAWTATSMAYAGVGYSIAAGSSSHRFVWWTYNNGSPVLSDGDTLPTLGPADAVLFLNKGGIGALVPNADVVDGSLIVSGSILAPAIAADQIQTSHIAAGAVTTTQLSAGAVEADNVAAGAITTDKLAVGSVGDNLVTNGSFEEFTAGFPVGWALESSANGGSSDVVSGVASSGAYALRLIATGTTSDVRVWQDITKQIPVSAIAGRKWYVAASVGAGTATTKGFYLRVNWFTAAGAASATPTTDVAANVAVATSWTVVEGQVTPPSDAAYMRVAVLLVSPSVATNVYVDEVTAREVVVSALIADGSITTPKLVANSVTATQLAANSVTATAIAAGTITTAELSATAINGMTITGATLIGGVVEATGTSTSTTITTQLGAAAAFDPSAAGGVGAPVPGLGFITSPAQAQTAGVFSPDGLAVTMVEGGPGGTGGGSHLSAGSGNATVYAWQAATLEGRGGVTVMSDVGNVQIQGNTGVSITGPLTANGANVGAPLGIGSAQNLNTYTTTGTFHQSNNTDAAGGTNYPVPIAGLLEVFTYNGFTYQRYSTYYTIARSFWRGLYNGNWSPWSEYASNGAWTKLANASGWSDYTGGGGYRGGIWARQFGDNVQISGMVVGGSGTIATLPTGLIPAYSAMYPAVAVGAACGVVIDGAANATPGVISYLFGPASPGYVNLTLTIPLH